MTTNSERCDAADQPRYQCEPTKFDENICNHHHQVIDGVSYPGKFNSQQSEVAYPTNAEERHDLWRKIDDGEVQITKEREFAIGKQRCDNAYDDRKCHETTRNITCSTHEGGRFTSNRPEPCVYKGRCGEPYDADVHDLMKPGSHLIEHASEHATIEQPESQERDYSRFDQCFGVTHIGKGSRLVRRPCGETRESGRHTDGHSEFVEAPQQLPGGGTFLERAELIKHLKDAGAYTERVQDLLERVTQQPAATPAEPVRCDRCGHKIDSEWAASTGGLCSVCSATTEPVREGYDG